jgi:hypothetical protein
MLARRPSPKHRRRNDECQRPNLVQNARSVPPQWALFWMARRRPECISVGRTVLSYPGGVHGSASVAAAASSTTRRAASSDPSSAVSSYTGGGGENPKPTRRKARWLRTYVSSGPMYLRVISPRALAGYTATGKAFIVANTVCPSPIHRQVKLSLSARYPPAEIQFPSAQITGRLGLLLQKKRGRRGRHPPNCLYVTKR